MTTEQPASQNLGLLLPGLRPPFLENEYGRPVEEDGTRCLIDFVIVADSALRHELHDNLRTNRGFTQATNDVEKGKPPIDKSDPNAIEMQPLVGSQGEQNQSTVPLPAIRRESEGVHNFEKIQRQRNFEENLRQEGLVIHERVSKKDPKITFIMIHAPFAVLGRYAQILHMNMPLSKDLSSKIERGFNEQGVEGSNADSATEESFFTKMMRKIFVIPELPPMKKEFTADFDMDRLPLFDLPEDREKFFSRGQRIYIVDFILQRMPYNTLITSEEKVDPAKQRSQDQESKHLWSGFGLQSLIQHGVYKETFPLHDSHFERIWEHEEDCETDKSYRGAIIGEDRKKVDVTLRNLLYTHWASWRNIGTWKYQPLDQIREYLGEQFAFYFAWLGFYTFMLIPASIFGILILFYGIRIVFFANDIVSNEKCSATNITMCKNCQHCPNWQMSDFCMYYKMQRIFDNVSTFIWASFISLWSTVFLELWKRKQATLQYRWDLTEFDAGAEPPRPAYIRIQAKKYKYNPVTHLHEPQLHFWRNKVPRASVSYGGIIFLVVMCLAFLIGIILYRMVILLLLLQANFPFASILTTATAACINLLIISLLNIFYERLACWLTDIEQWRTQSEYDNAVTIKLYMLQFVNYYNALIYIAFFKGRFGLPGDKGTLSGRIEQCSGGSCLADLFVQLAITMLGKQLVQNTLMEVLMPFLKPLIFRMINCIKGCCKKEQSAAEKQDCIVCTPCIERDYSLTALSERPLFGEYLEMVIQYGFLTIFAVAFPLAPFCAFLNNVLEVRSDSYKFLVHMRRPVPDLEERDIGVWYSILFFLSRFAVISNGLLIAFTSDYVPRAVYKYLYNENGSYRGYINFSLSKYIIYNITVWNNTQSSSSTPNPLNAIQGNTTVNTSICFFQDHRNVSTETFYWDPYNRKMASMPEVSIGEHDLTFWQVLVWRVAIFCVFDHAIFLITSFIAWAIPDVPDNVAQRSILEQYLLTEALLDYDRKKFARGHHETKTKEGSTDCDHGSNLTCTNEKPTKAPPTGASDGVGTSSLYDAAASSSLYPQATASQETGFRPDSSPPLPGFNINMNA